MSAIEEIEIEEVSENGRPLCFLIDASAKESLPPWLADFVKEKAHTARILKISYRTIDYQNLEVLAHKTIECLAQHRIRQAAFVTYGMASLILWKIALTQQKLVRNAIVINGESRPPIARRERIFDWLEARLPLGLPFRGHNGYFHALPFLQRLRFPVFILTVAPVSQRLQDEAEALKRELPIAWSKELEKTSELSETLLELTTAFHSVPTKCPQKNRAPKNDVDVMPEPVSLT